VERGRDRCATHPGWRAKLMGRSKRGQGGGGLVGVHPVANGDGQSVGRGRTKGGTDPQAKGWGRAHPLGAGSALVEVHFGLVPCHEAPPVSKAKQTLDERRRGPDTSMGVRVQGRLMKHMPFRGVAALSYPNPSQKVLCAITDERFLHPIVLTKNSLLSQSFGIERMIDGKN